MEHDSTSSAVSGIKVLDRSVDILQTVAQAPCTLAQLCDVTGLPRATTHRLASALEVHDFLSRDSVGRWQIGSGLVSLAAGHGDALITAATPLMEAIKDRTGESVQLYRIAGNARICVAAVEPTAGLHNTVPVGSRLSLSAGSAAHVFAAFSTVETEAAAAIDRELIRRQGWSSSFSEREPGLASVSAPVFNSAGSLVAALSVSGPEARFPRDAGAKWGPLLVDAAQKLQI